MSARTYVTCRPQDRVWMGMGRPTQKERWRGSILAIWTGTVVPVIIEVEIVRIANSDGSCCDTCIGGSRNNCSVNTIRHQVNTICSYLQKSIKTKRSYVIRVWHLQDLNLGACTCWVQALPLDALHVPCYT